MKQSVIQEVERDGDQVLDVERLIEAVRGSRAARVLFEYRFRLNPVNPPAANTESALSDESDLVA